MQKTPNQKIELPDGIKACISFHGHLCPGLVYGYRVAQTAMALLGLHRSHDEEVVAISENDSCAVDALQVVLGTSAGKGNLIVKDYGKNAYTILNRTTGKAYRFARKATYRYQGDAAREFAALEKAVADGTATEQQKMRQKLLKSIDLLSKPFEEVFTTEAVDAAMPAYAPLAPSQACARCGEMTMATKMVAVGGQNLCRPCADAAAK